MASKLYQQQGSSSISSSTAQANKRFGFGFFAEKKRIGKKGIYFKERAAAKEFDSGTTEERDTAKTRQAKERI